MPRRLLSYYEPDDLTGLVAWLKADALALNDDDLVASWTDSSANSNTPTQATDANKPTYKTSVINGKPVIRFDGGDRLVMPTEGNFDIAAPSIFVVAKRNSGTTGSIMAKSTTSFSDGRRRKMQISTSATGIAYASGADSQSIGVASTPANWNMFGVVTNSEMDHSLFLNGVETIFTTTLDDDNVNNAGMEIGAAFGNGAEAFNGDIAEIIVFNRALTGFEAVGLQNYLATKYNLMVSLALGASPRTAVSGRVLLRDYGNAVKTNYAAGSSVTWTATPFLAATEVTACLWLKLLRNTASIYDVPFGFGNTRWFLIFNSTTNRPGFHVKISSTEYSSGFITSPLELNKYYLLIGTYDPAGGANNLKIRVYDQAGHLYGTASSTQTGNMDSTVYPLTFGRDVVRAYNMDVEGDEMHVYSRILTTDEQSALALGTEPNTSGLELWARCNQTSGNLTDSSGNSRTGTNNAGCTFVRSLGGGTRALAGSGVSP